MTTAHTRGPWTLETVPTSIGICHKIGPFPGSCGREVGHACVYVDGIGRRGNAVDELLANAKLIAAAPDLLDACRAWISWLECGDEDEPDLEQQLAQLMRDAIAKATA